MRTTTDGVRHKNARAFFEQGFNSGPEGEAQDGLSSGAASWTEPGAQQARAA